MALTQINGGTQIRSGTITTTQLASAAGIVDGQLATSYTKADGTRAFTGSQSFGGFEATNAATPTSSSSLATKGYVDTLAQGLDTKYSARAATTGAETFTIASGTVTTINGTTIDGQTINIGEYILVKDAPATTGAGSANSTQPGNGLYIVTGNTTNLSVSRAAGQSTSESPAGDYVFIEAGTNYASSGWVVTSPSTNAAFTWGTGNVAWTQFTGAGEITVDSTLTKSGNALSRAAITGDVTIATNSNASTIAANAVTYAKFQTVAANSVVGNATGSTATAAAINFTAAATASTLMYRDASANARVNSIIENFQSIASAAGTTTLTVSSPRTTQITGATTQIVKTPDATTLVVGQQFVVLNRSSGVVTVNDNSSTLIQTMAAGSFLTLTVTGIGSAAGTWDAAYTSAGGSGSVTTVSVVSTNGFAGSVANASTTPAITISTTITGLLKGNGTAISAATLGSDYVDNASFITRETPTGTVNGSNTSFSLANTPTAGTELVFLNGMLQEPGSGNDYTISGATITYLAAPASGDKIRVSYMK
jgi:hypothetical protein